MSLYATQLSIDDHEHEPSCAVYRLLGDFPLAEAFKVEGGALIGHGSSEGSARVYARVPGASCSCGNPAPLVYRGSHLIPSADDPRGGSVTFCAIPDFLHPDVTPEMRERDEGFPVDFARLWVTAHSDDEGSAVVLERAQVEKLRDTLTQWLEAGERA